MTELNGTPSSSRPLEDPTDSGRPLKRMKSIRGISRLQNPTVVIAMGFAVGTTAEDIKEAFTTDMDDVLKANTVTCELLSRGPRVMAKLTYPNKAAAIEAVLAWNGSEVDENVLEVWVTDDKPAATRLPAKTFAIQPPATNGFTSTNMFGGSFGSSPVLGARNATQTNSNHILGPKPADWVNSIPPPPKKENSNPALLGGSSPAVVNKANNTNGVTATAAAAAAVGTVNSHKPANLFSALPATTSSPFNGLQSGTRPMHAAPAVPKFGAMFQSASAAPITTSATEYNGLHESNGNQGSTVTNGK